jgi:hydrogenase nickel incorporation protein HypA/HybF
VLQIVCSPIKASSRELVCAVPHILKRRHGRSIGWVHELSICQALLSQVTAIARERGAEAVESIVVEVGPLSGVDAQLLARAFEVARIGSCAAEAALSIEVPQVTVSCLGCGAQSHTAPNRLLCDACGGFRSRIIAGDELNLRRVELRARHLPATARTAVAATAMAGEKGCGARIDHV